MIEEVEQLRHRLLKEGKDVYEELVQCLKNSPGSSEGRPMEQVLYSLGYALAREDAFDIRLHTEELLPFVEQLRLRNQTMRGLLLSVNEYVETRRERELSSGSLLHQRIRAALAEGGQPHKYTYMETPTPPLNNRTD